MRDQSTSTPPRSTPDAAASKDNATAGETVAFMAGLAAAVVELADARGVATAEVGLYVTPFAVAATSKTLPFPYS